MSWWRRKEKELENGRDLAKERIFSLSDISHFLAQQARRSKPCPVQLEACLRLKSQIRYQSLKIPVWPFLATLRTKTVLRKFLPTQIFYFVTRKFFFICTINFFIFVFILLLSCAILEATKPRSPVDLRLCISRPLRKTMGSGDENATVQTTDSSPIQQIISPLLWWPSYGLGPLNRTFKSRFCNELLLHLGT